MTYFTRQNGYLRILKLKKPGNVDALINSWHDWAGTFTECVNKLRRHPDEIDDPEALCAWIEHEATGMWPREYHDYRMKNKGKGKKKKQD